MRHAELKWEVARRPTCSRPRLAKSTMWCGSKAATDGCDMKVIVPLAGKGTRLLPLTKRVPKPLVRVAGRPVMDYVMDAVKGLDVEELIVITGHLKESVERYILEHYDVPAKFVEQKKLDGTAGALNLARPSVDSPVLIIFVDTGFQGDLTLLTPGGADGIIWAKEGEDYPPVCVVGT